MKEKKELKIFRKTSIEYLKRMYHESATYILDKSIWRSTAPETYGQSRVLLRTRRSLKRFGADLNIFKMPTIEGVKIVYHRSKNYMADMFRSERLVAISEENYLLRDLSPNADYLNDNELKIFRFASIDKLESLYYKSVGKL
jgi:hypothetical protein